MWFNRIFYNSENCNQRTVRRFLCESFHSYIAKQMQSDFSSSSFRLHTLAIFIKSHEISNKTQNDIFFPVKRNWKQKKDCVIQPLNQVSLSYLRKEKIDTHKKFGEKCVCVIVVVVKNLCVLKGTSLCQNIDFCI